MDDKNKLLMYIIVAIILSSISRAILLTPMPESLQKEVAATLDKDIEITVESFGWEYEIEIENPQSTKESNHNVIVAGHDKSPRLTDVDLSDGRRIRNLIETYYVFYSKNGQQKKISISKDLWDDLSVGDHIKIPN